MFGLGIHFRDSIRGYEGASKSMNVFWKMLLICDHFEAQKGFVESFSEVADICFFSVFGEKIMS